jgi:hypothetical protein
MWRYASQLPYMLTSEQPIPCTSQFVPSIMLRLACAMRQPNMPYKKVSHRKVRTGCIQCKRRRVKVRASCDIIPLLSPRLVSADILVVLRKKTKMPQLYSISVRMQLQCHVRRWPRSCAYHFAATAEASCFACPVWPPRVFFLGLQAPTPLDRVNS